MADVTKTVKDAAYVAVGLGVLGFQRAQVRRRELTKELETQLGQTTDQLQRLAKELEERLEPIFGLVEERLPEQARDLVKQARTTAREAQEQLLARSRRSTPRAA